MKVLFIQENGVQESIGVASLAGMLRAHGHTCDLLLLSHTPRLEEAIERNNPQLIGFSALTGMHQPLLRLAQRIKKEFSIPIIMGGPHPTYYPDVIESAGIDMICRGEGEWALLELVEKMSKGDDLRQIQNIYFKDNGGTVYKNPLRELACLDELPMPGRDIYYQYSFLRDMPMKRFMASMGCPHQCGFCHQPLMNRLYQDKGKYLRRKSVVRVLEEIKDIKKCFPLRHVHFSDDLFVMPGQESWLEEFAQRYLQEIGLPFTCNVRYDVINRRAVEILKKARLFGVSIGMETGNDRLRELVLRKRIIKEDMVAAAHLLKEFDIKVLTTNMVSLPGETLDQAFETVALNRQLQTNYSRVNTFLLFPGLPLVDYAVKEGFLDSRFDMNTQEAQAMEICLTTRFAKEFRNLCCLFWIYIHLPHRWIPWMKRVVRWPENRVFKFLGLLGSIQEILFYRIPFWPAWLFFKNTVLVSSEGMVMRNIPRMLKRKKEKA